MVFECGHKVVHKTHGVGEIEGSEILDLGGQQQDYYILKIVSTGLKVRFPKQTSTQIVRNLVTEAEIEEIFEIITSPAKTYSMVWNRRKKEFNEKINSGSVFEISEVFRDLRAHGRLDLAISGGSMEGSLLASMVFPAPGGPIITTLWPPAAAISRARLARCWAFTSFMSG